MIVDLLLDAFFGPIVWFLEQLPEMNATSWFHGIAGGAMSYFVQAFAFADYLLPVTELFVIVVWGAGLLFVVGFVRWILRFIPGMGG